jgi:hypothetical protein
MNSMAWLALLVWIGVPVLAGWMFIVLPKRAKTTPQRKLAIAASIGVLIVPWLISSGVKWHYDQQVRELCAKDGGVAVFETVKLSPEKYDELKRVNFILPDKLRAKPTDEYYSVTDHYDYRLGNPEVSRRQYRIIRNSDQKVLGELVFYGRGGGDLPGPWHGSSFTCPSPTKVNFETAIFLIGDKQ